MPPFSETRATRALASRHPAQASGRRFGGGKGTTGRAWRCGCFDRSSFRSCCRASSSSAFQGAAAQTDDRLAEAADAARELSVLEAERDFDALYERMHPDALAVVPRSAVVGWYESTFRT